MPLPGQTFSTISQLLAYINQYIIPNGMNDIDGSELNNVENAMANFIVNYTLNSSLVTIVSSTAPYQVSTPITLFTAAPSSITLPGNVQNEYYLVNATGINIPCPAYYNAYGQAISYIPLRTAVHLAKAENGSWIRVNNLPGNVAITTQNTSDITFTGDGSVEQPLEATINFSTSTQSKYLLNENGGPFFYGTKIRNIVGQGTLPYYILPNNFLTQSIESVVKNGAASSGVVTAVGAYDKIAVTGGDNTSYLSLTNVVQSNSGMRYILKCLVNTKGAAPLVGIFLKNAPNTNDTNFSSKQMFANLITGVVTRKQTAGTSTVVQINSASSPFVTNGDIIEVEYVTDPVTGVEQFSIRDLTSGAYIAGLFTAIQMSDSSSQGFESSAHNLAIILADGTYTILDFKALPFAPYRPKIMVIGDSVGIGYNILPNVAFTYQLANAIPYQVSQNAGLGQYIYSIARNNVQEILIQRPQVVILFTYLSLYWVEFLNTSPTNAAYMAAFNATMNSILSVGGIPVLIQVPSWPLATQPDVDAWNVFVTQQAALFAGTLILDLRGTTPTYDSSGYHPDGPYYTVILNLFLQLLESNGLL